MSGGLTTRVNVPRRRLCRGNATQTTCCRLASVTKAGGVILVELGKGAELCHVFHADRHAQLLRLPGTATTMTACTVSG